MMFKIKKEKIQSLLKGIDKQVCFIAAITALLLLFYIDPLAHVDLTDWNRTFSPAILSGISIDKRIQNFYLLFFCFIPLVFILSLLFYTLLFHIRDKYKTIHLKISIMLMCCVAVSYFSRYTAGASADYAGILVKTMLAFQIILAVVALADVKQIFSFSDITSFFVGYMIAVISSDILLRINMNISILIVGACLICYVTVICKTPFGIKIFKTCQNFIFILMWTPTVLRLVLEGIYFLTEKGETITDYYTCVLCAAFIFILLTVTLLFLFRKKDWSFSSFGYIGAITSISALSFFQYAYQYVWSYSTYAKLYEAGNGAVVMDSFLYGKLPIADYFSAHAVGDVWMRIIYCLVHSDIKGIFATPYRGLTFLAGLFALFYIIKTLFDRDTAVLFLFLFPCYCSNVKIITICLMSVAVLLYIIKQPETKSYLWFWLLILISAFITYDEGISLGIACISAYMILIFREHDKLKRFILSGIAVGGAALFSYIVYALFTGIPVISRMKEWLSVGVNSSSTWATAVFGDPSTFAFLLSYLVVPVSAVTILVITSFLYIKDNSKESRNMLQRQLNSASAAITVAFALAQLLFFTRTIVYHNLDRCSGQNGVLLNYVHWTVSLFILYLYTRKGSSCEKKLFAWIATFGIIILAEGTLVTGILPDSASSVFARAADASENWNLHNNTTDNLGKERIVFDEATNTFVQQFKQVFDTLLTEEQTFIDFANITSLYALTGRTRPCYVGQSPGLLTDLYSQECFLTQIAEYDCPLAILGTTEDAFTQQMIGIPHNIRYYKIAEYIYQNYRPLVKTGDFVIWCRKDLHTGFTAALNDAAFPDMGYTLVDYGYDSTTLSPDEQGALQASYQPYHQFSLDMIPYIWANRDEYLASENDVLVKLENSGNDSYTFSGSQNVMGTDGNYLKFECSNPMENNIPVTVTFQDSHRDGIRYEYSFTAVPGSNTYMIRTSQDYFWNVFNIDTIEFTSENGFEISNLEILAGD